MTYDNKHTDKKLQELEVQSLPDLSNMDEHWMQMKTLLVAGAPASPKRKVFGRKLYYLLPGTAVILLVSFFLYRNNHQHSKAYPARNVPVVKTITPADSPRLAKLTILKKTDSTTLAEITFLDGKDSASTRQPVKESQNTSKNKLLLEKFYEQQQKKPQVFLIDNKKDTIIYGKEGTSLYIPANSFHVKGGVTLLLTEFYSVNDMITNKLTTTSDGRLLASGGMIYLDATDKDGKLVDLEKGAQLKLEMPKRRNQQMELFYGYDYYRNDTTTVMDSINWNRAKQVFTNSNKSEREALLIQSTEKEKNQSDTLKFVENGTNSRLEYIGRDTIAQPGSPIRVIKSDSVIEQRYGVNINRLGWINCDRFYNDPRPKVELIVDLHGNPNSYYTVLIMDKFTSLMPASSTQGTTIRFSNLPEGEAVRIISLGIKDGLIVAAMQKLVASNTVITNMNFEKVAPSAFGKKLDE